MTKTGQVIWITGLSGAGKTTLAKALLPLLPGPVLWLDGDDFRQVVAPVAGGYEREDRLRLSVVYCRLCLLAAGQGQTVVCSSITMFHEIQDWNRQNLPNYFEVYLDYPEEVRLARDYKNVYKPKNDGLASPVVGRHIPPEAPRNPELHLTDPDMSPEEIARLLIQALAERFPPLPAAAPQAEQLPLNLR